MPLEHMRNLLPFGREGAVRTSSARHEPSRAGGSPRPGATTAPDFRFPRTVWNVVELRPTPVRPDRACSCCLVGRDRTEAPADGAEGGTCLRPLPAPAARRVHPLTGARKAAPRPVRRGSGRRVGRRSCFGVATGPGGTGAGRRPGRDRAGRSGWCIRTGSGRGCGIDPGAFPPGRGFPGRKGPVFGFGASRGGGLRFLADRTLSPLAGARQMTSRKRA